ncbi:MAG TPA: hypothetical protein VJP59_01025, partial [Gemmatimonadota bacterium]|nr:hypothetical protein [Gemmatimonadota bacterium]
DIAELFPTENDLRQDAVAECGRIYQDFDDGDEDAAAERAFQFFGRTLEQNENGELLDPAPSAEQKIADIFTAIFDDLGLDFPDIEPDALESGEFAVGTLVPNGPPLITASRHAGIDDGGGLLGPVQVIIVQIQAESGGLQTSSAEHPCPAGIDDRFDCYPLFYDYTVVPASNVNPAVGLRLGQCNISPPDVEVVLATPEGILPEDDSPVGLDCTDVQPQTAMTGWRSYAWSVLEPIAPLFRVREAFAGKNPVGGRISAFSPVAPVRAAGGGGVEEPPPPGTDIVVFNDVNVFDNTGMSDPDNVVLVRNLVDFTTAGPRDDGTEVWVDCRSSVATGAHGGCQNPSTFRTTIEGQGLTLVDVFEGSLDDLPPEVKVLFLWIPSDPYPASEVNAFKQFAAEGGRVIFVGENAGFYGCCFALQNALLEAFGATLRNSGGIFHTGYFQLPQSSLRTHQITEGVGTLTIAASSEIVLGPGDFALYFDATETHVLSGVATIDTTPISGQLAASRAVRIHGTPPPTLDTVGRPVIREP